MSPSLLPLSLALLLLVAAVAPPAAAVVKTKCQTARELVAAGIAKSQLGDWLCLVQHESSYNTAAKNVNTNGSTDYGIFQINNNYWCAEAAPGKDCNIKCSSLVNDDISDDIACAKIIYKRHGFTAWYGWLNYCKGKPLPSYTECF